MEIERKYMIKKMPNDLKGYPCKKIEQGYLCNNPILRIRKSNEDYYITYKSKKGLENKQDKAIINQEVELPLTEETYELLKNKVDGNMVYKNRYLIPLDNGLTAELDVFEAHLKGLIYVEVEFPDEASVDTFEPPAWFDRDISWDKRYSNYYLSQISSSEELF